MAIKKRLFLAITLPKKVRQELVKGQRALARQLPKDSVKWVEEENLHLTLIFLGYVDAEEIKMDLESFGSFTLYLDKLGFFPEEERARVIWVGIGGEVKKLRKLYQKIAGSLKIVGLSFRERFSAHITLGRFRHNGERCWTDFKKEPFLVKEVKLIESVLSPQGPVYRVIKSWKV